MRKKAIVLGLLLMMGMMVVGGCNAGTNGTASVVDTKEKIYQRPEVVNAEQAKQLLVDGNKRFSSGQLLKKNMGDARLEELYSKGQKPFAVILCCSDSRVPPELVFDQALGDIFIIRVAGNVVSPIVMGSIEYGVEHLHVPLLVILGHENCGAVKATVDGGEAPGNIADIVEKIKPSVAKAKAAGATGNALYEKACDENTQAMKAEVEKSEIVKELIEHGKLQVVTAKYYLSNGEVKFDQ